jgi:hypothetical protein
MGGAGGRRIKTPSGRKALPVGMGPAIEALQAGLTLRRQRRTAESLLSQRYVGSSRLKDRGDLPEGETSEG